MIIVKKNYIKILYYFLKPKIVEINFKIKKKCDKSTKIIFALDIYIITQSDTCAHISMQIFKVILGMFITTSIQMNILVF